MPFARRAIPLVLAVLVTAAIATVVTLRITRPTAGPVVRLSLEVPEGRLGGFVGVGQSMRRICGQTRKDVGAIDDRRFGRIGQRHLDDFNAQTRGVRVGDRDIVVAAGQL